MSIDSQAGRVAIALLHNPVYDKNRRVVTTAVTNLDLHDIARVARTFGLCRYYVVTPISLQHALAERIRLHWIEGWGAGYNASRKEAMELMRVVSTLDDAVADMTQIFGNRPQLAVTGAKGRADAVGASQVLELLDTQENPLLLMFGTGWGLTEEIFDRADLVLEPILGNSDYNHLSVRSAVSIYLDRLFGR
jgi:hypothetical protein